MRKHNELTYKDYDIQFGASNTTPQPVVISSTYDVINIIGIGNDIDQTAAPLIYLTNGQYVGQEVMINYWFAIGFLPILIATLPPLALGIDGSNSGFFDGGVPVYPPIYEASPGNPQQFVMNSGNTAVLKWNGSYWIMVTASIYGPAGQRLNWVNSIVAAETISSETSNTAVSA